MSNRHKVKILICVFMLTCMNLGNAFSQFSSGRQRTFVQAESHFLFEEYSKALTIYLNMLNDQPENAFLSYRTGQCYLNIPGKKALAIEYLEKAVENIDHSNRRRITRRTVQAPQDALFYLGRAYHINYMFEEALEAYQKFLDQLDPMVYNPRVVEDHIISTHNAMESVTQPVAFRRANLGERINTGNHEINPAVSGNEEVLVFTRRVPDYEGIFFSVKQEDNNWSEPVDISMQLECAGDCHPVSVSWDGTRLYLFRTDRLVGNIYVSHFRDDQWSPAIKLNENINTRHWESHASETRCGDTLYFTSNRPGGLGGLDIYFSVRNRNGVWGPAVNLGSPVNTAHNEDTPFITDDGRKLFFSSLGHFNIGEHDIFYAERDKNGKWLPPQNIGYGINTPDNDQFFNPVGDGQHAYFSVFNPEGSGQTDIYRYEILSTRHHQMFLLSGFMKRLDGKLPGESAYIAITGENGDTLFYENPGPSGWFTARITPGSWKIAFSEEDHDEFTWNIDLSPESKEFEIRIMAYLEVREPVLPELSLVIPEYTPVAARQLAYRAVPPESPVLDTKPVLTVAEAIETNDPAETVHLVAAEPETDPGETHLPADLTEEEQIPADTQQPSQQDADTLKPEVFETPAPDDDGEIAEPGRVVPIWWILALILLLLIAIIYRKQTQRTRGQ